MIYLLSSLARAYGAGGASRRAARRAADPPRRGGHVRRQAHPEVSSNSPKLHPTLSNSTQLSAISFCISGISRNSWQFLQPICQDSIRTSILYFSNSSNFSYNSFKYHTPLTTHDVFYITSLARLRRRRRFAPRGPQGRGPAPQGRSCAPSGAPRGLPQFHPSSSNSIQTLS
jgi:hypothetical protein